MVFATRIFDHLPFRRRISSPKRHDLSEEIEVLVRAQGYCLSLLGAILEREGLSAADELAQALDDFAAITAVDHPAEGHLLSRWAMYMQDAFKPVQDSSEPY